VKLVERGREVFGRFVASVVIVMIAPPHALMHLLQGLDNSFLLCGVLVLLFGGPALFFLFLFLRVVLVLLLGDLALFFLLGVVVMRFGVRMLRLWLHLGRMGLLVLMLGVLGARRTCCKRITHEQQGERQRGYSSHRSSPFVWTARAH